MCWSLMIPTGTYLFPEPAGLHPHPDHLVVIIQLLTSSVTSTDVARRRKMKQRTELGLAANFLKIPRTFPLISHWQDWITYLFTFYKRIWYLGLYIFPLKKIQVLVAKKKGRWCEQLAGFVIEALFNTLY